MPGPVESQDKSSDRWSQWLLKRRHGGDEAYNQRVQEVVNEYRDRVLDAANLLPGMTLADIGTGEGLIAFGAIDRIGPSLRVIATDISQPMLQHTKALALQRGVGKQITFILGSADDLSGIADQSVDVLTTRSVLAYVNDKAAAFREFRRVLKPGGRLSLFEPIMQDDAFESISLARVMKFAAPRQDSYYLQWRHRLLAAQFGDTLAGILNDPVTGFNERDLFQHAREAGFANLRVNLEIQLRPLIEIAWNTHLGISIHPGAPTLGEILATFPEEEVQEFERVFRPIVEAGKGQQKSSQVYLTGNRAAS